MNILIVGGAGKTAEPIIDSLSRKNHQITIFDIVPVNSGIEKEKYNYIHGDITNIEAVNNAMENVDIVIHLAVNISDIENDKLTFEINVFGLYNILCAALKNKISKVLIASSAPVHMIDEAKKDFDYICSTEEDFAYDLTKNIQEVIAQHFCRTYSLNCLILRLGHIVDGKSQTSLSGAPLSELSYCKGGWVCKYDVAEAFTKAVEADFIEYNLINIIGSHQAEDRFDILAAKKLIGFECHQKFLGF